MAHTVDEHMRRALELVADRVRRDLGEDLERVATDLSAAVQLEQHRIHSLLDAVRTLDRTTSLSEALDALGAAAREHTDRSALLLVRGSVLRAWSLAGFDEIPQPGFEIPLTEAGVLADVVRTGGPASVDAGVADDRPSFARSATQALVAVPVAMNGDVVAVLCGEARAEISDRQALSMVLELLARHAARVLESLTARRLASIGPAEPGRGDTALAAQAQAVS